MHFKNKILMMIYEEGFKEAFCYRRDAFEVNMTLR